MLVKEADTIVHRAQTDLARAKDRVVGQLGALRSKAHAYAESSPVRTKLEARLTAAATALVAGRIPDAQKELDAADAALQGEPEGR